MNPIEQLQTDRMRARELQDPWANLCAFATMGDDGMPEARTLVLRDVAGELAVFLNATSPKWREIEQTPYVAVLVFLASLNVQYRMRAVTAPVPGNIVAESWQLRPHAPKRMDWFYTATSAQSRHVADRETLLAGLNALDLPDPLIAPHTARGLYLRPERIERLDLNQSDGVHDRRRYHLESGRWVESVVVP